MRIILFALLLFIGDVLYSQVRPIAQHGSGDQDSLSNLVMNADTAFHTSGESVEIDTLIGNVILTQDSLVMYCNRATVLDRINAKAYGDVIIIHHDSIHIFADSMYYNGSTKIAELFGEVILKEGDRRLYTTELLYNVNDKTAQYLVGGTVIDVLDTIRSKEGYYYQTEQKIRLKGNVSFVDTSRILRTDSVLYLYNIDQLNIIAPTEILQDSVIIYCEAGLYRLKSDRGILSDNVQVKSADQLITSGILDIKGAEDIYTFLIHPKIEDGEGIAKGDTIVFFDKKGIVELRFHASYKSPTETMNAPVIRYHKHTDSYSTVGRAKVVTEENTIEADEITSEGEEVTRLSGSVIILDNESKIKIESQKAIKAGHTTKLFSDLTQPLLTYVMTSDSLILLADTLISTEEFVNIAVIDSSAETANLDIANNLETINQDTISNDSNRIDIQGEVAAKVKGELMEQVKQKMFYGINGVRFMNGQTYGSGGQFAFNKRDSVITLTERPILWSDSTQLTGDTIEIYLRNNDIYKITLINNALIVSPDSSGMYNQIKGIKIDNIMQQKMLSKAIVHGNAELFYMIKDGDSYQGINLTRSNQMTFTFEDDTIAKIQMDGKPESNMYQYTAGMDLSIYYLEGFSWRIDERPKKETFVMKSKIIR